MVIVFVDPAGQSGTAFGLERYRRGAYPQPSARVRWKRSTLPLVWGRRGLVRWWRIDSSAQVSRHRCEM